MENLADVLKRVFPAVGAPKLDELMRLRGKWMLIETEQPDKQGWNKTEMFQFGGIYQSYQEHSRLSVVLIYLSNRTNHLHYGDGKFYDSDGGGNKTYLEVSVL